MALVSGFSGNPNLQVAYNTTGIDTIINQSKSKNCNAYRIAFNAPFNTSGSRPYSPNGANYIKRILDTSNMIVIVDRNHRLNSGATSGEGDTQAQWDQHWIDAENALADVANQFSSYPVDRLWLEIINEYRPNSNWTYVKTDDLSPRCQVVINHLRSTNNKYGRVFTNPIVMHYFKQTAAQQVKLQDPLNKTYQGIHYYFNETTRNPVNEINTLKSKGVTNILNTEIGASWSINAGGTDGYGVDSYIANLNNFMEWGYQNGVSNFIWGDSDNHAILDGYNVYAPAAEKTKYPPWGLNIRGFASVPQFTLSLSSIPAGVPWTIDGVPNKPAGNYLINQGATVTLQVPNQVSG